MIKEILKEQMEYHNINQSDLVLKTGIDQKRLSDILNGKRKLTIDTSYKLGKAFSLEGNWLFDYQEKENRLEQMENDESLVKAASFISTLNSFKKVAKISILEKVSNIFKASSFSDYKNFVNKKVIGKKSYKDKVNAYLWIALMENKFGTKKSPKKFIANDGNKVINSVIHTMLSDLPFEIKMGKTKALLHDGGIILENGPFIPDSTIYGVSLSKNLQRYIFMSDMGKRECKYVFTLIHELVHIYGRNNLTEKEVDKITFDKISKVIAKEDIANKDMDIYLNAFETNEWDSIYEKAKVKIGFGEIESLFIDAR